MPMSQEPTGNSRPALWGPPGSTPPTWGAAPVSPDRGRRRWPLVIGAVVLCAVTAVVTAGIAWALHRQSLNDSGSTNVPNAAPSHSASEQMAAKVRLCDTFDTATKGARAGGAIKSAGQLNVPVALRALNGAVAVREALTPSVPSETADAAESYIKATLELTTVAIGDAPTEESNRLNEVSNDAIRALAGECRLS